MEEMKAKLEFDLGDLDDVMAHLRCVKSLDMALALWKVYQLCCLDEGEINSIEMQKRILDIFEEYDINLDDLVR